ncbi:protein LURP-one-related 6-like [Zingiber officinale]|uniref:protein LURP-one-related 6-like n=1 Tax=Zingiber officinale TaxID=94328 RepID=UPI001C4CB3F8|nr:protein LURP-one-related 6-like [Zingiber officinale]
MSEPGKLMPIISKAYCSSSPITLTVRQRPRVISGGGFVVMNSTQNAVFMVEGCSSLGAKGQLRLKDGHGGLLLSITKKESIVQSLSIRNRWDGYSIDCEGEKKFIFSLTDPKCPIGKEIKIKIEHQGATTKGCRQYFQVNGSFVHRTCSIEDHRGNIIAQLEAKGSNGRDWYNVTVQPGHDQAFVIGVLAVLDNIHGESTRC